ncbi:MAG TPA: AAA family ATPase [Bacillota bacterium]|mgnify:FL=1|nr:AAA family ATPase [Bacillota bacterium]
MAYILSFANQKGGVGKTTSAVNVAACLAHRGKRVLLIDMDPQGNTTSGVGVSKRGLKTTVYEALLGQVPVKAAIIPTRYDNLHLLPATISLAGAEFDLIDVIDRESCLKTALVPVVGNYDYVIIDCPPSLGLLTINSLTASNGAVIPMQCEYFALEGLSQLMLTIRKIKQHYNRQLEITGILLTMYNPRLNLTLQVVNELKKYYSDKLFRTPIVRNVKLSEAPSFGTPIIYHDPGSKGALAYIDVSDELIIRTSV